MRTVMILRGLPGSAKSTFARELMKREPKRWKRFNKDDLRSMIDDNIFDHEREEFIRKIQDQLIITAIRDGFDVIIDNTHLVPATLKKLHRLLESVGDIKVLEKCFNVSIEECLKRNALREGHARVPDKAIEGMAKSAGIDRGRKLEDREVYYAPKISLEPYAIDESLPPAIICDLDGTLANMNGRNPYDASTCDQDLPNMPVVRCVEAMYLSGYQIIFMSGREDKYSEPTKVFIEKHLPNMPYELYMRLSNDSRKDSIVKHELFENNVLGKYNILFVLDDRAQVVNHWRAIGLTCFQVAEGNF